MKRLNVKGITLVTLVVTIIVLLILVAVSMNLVVGENGVVIRAKQASKMATLEGILDDIKLKVADYQIYKNSKGTETLTEYFDRKYSMKVYEAKSNQYFIEEGNVICFVDISKGIVKNYERWDGFVADGFESGDGTEANPYIIKTAGQLAYLSKVVKEGNNLEGKFIRQIDTIVLNQYITNENLNSISSKLKMSEPIGNETTKFSGIYFGDYNYIYGMYQVSTENNIGLFGYINTASIGYVNMIGSYIKGNTAVGGIIGNSYRNLSGYWSESAFCWFKGIVVGNSSVGGIVGKATGFFASYYNEVYGSVSGNNSIGGILGDSSSDRDYPIEVYQCFNYASVKGNNSVGGLTGYSGRNTLIWDSGNEGEVTGTNAQTGGVLGRAYNWGSVQRCYNKGTVTGKTDVGGIVGGNQIKMYNCYNTGKVTGVTNVGGILGNLAADKSAAANTCYNTGKVSGTTAIGDIVGLYTTAGQVINSFYYNKNVGAVNGNDFLKTDGSTNYAIEITRNQLYSPDFWKNNGYSVSVWNLIEGQAPKLFWEK